MSLDFSWLKEIKLIKSSKKSVKEIQYLLEVNQIKGFEIELLGRSLNEIKNLDSLNKLKIAILSDNSTQPISNAIKVACIRENYNPIIYEGPFGSLQQEILNIESNLYKFKPDIIFIDICYRSITNMPQGILTKEEVKNRIDLEIKNFEILWTQIKKKLNKPIIQNTIVSPSLVYRDLSEYKINWSPIKFIEELNNRFINLKSFDINWLDLDRLSKIVGLSNWHDSRLFHHARYGFAIEFLPEYSNWIKTCIRSINSNIYKALIVDLDNTLWGGIIGDDGIDGIQIGPNSSEGNCYQDFCNYLLALRERGLILGICSKNELNNVKEVFDKHPNMPLSLDDFSSVRCNWLNKSQNLIDIAHELNIDLSSIVFIDDNPAECELIRQSIPEIYTLNLSPDPSKNISKLDKLNLFKLDHLTSEDISRKKSYLARRKFQEEKVNFTDINDYLISLNMKSHFEKVDEKHILRIEQMQLKTNQFNLSTNRYKRDQIRNKILNKDLKLYVIRLSDKFSDHGIISYIELQQKQNAIEIYDWLISCRVFSRTLEEYILKMISNKFKDLDISKIKISYKQSLKNKLMKDKLKELGFEIKENKNGTEIWISTFSKINSLKTFIK